MFLFILSITLSCVVEDGFGEAPPNTVVLPQLFSDFSATFENCRFDAVQVSDLVSPKRTKDHQEARIKAAICPDCVTMNSRTTIVELDLANGKKVSGEIRDDQVRWKAGQAVEQIELRFKTDEEWPVDSAPPLEKPQVRSVLIRKNPTDAKKQIFNKLLIADFVFTESNSGLSLTAIAAEKFGYRIQKTYWASEDRDSQVTSYLSSPEYGIARITCRKIQGRWYPNRVELERLPQHKMVADEQVPIGVRGMNRASMYDARKAEFNTPLVPITKLERIYEMTYRSSGDTVTPATISRVELIHRGIENVRIERTLRFDQFKKGEVPCDAVTGLSVTLPDGCIAAKEGDSKRDYTTLNNKVVPKTATSEILDFQADEREDFPLSGTSSWNNHCSWLMAVVGIVSITSALWFLSRKKSA